MMRQSKERVSSHFFLKLFLSLVVIVVSISLYTFSHSKKVIMNNMIMSTEQTISHTVDRFDYLTASYENMTFDILSDAQLIEYLKMYSHQELEELQRLIILDKIKDQLTRKSMTKDGILNIHLLSVDPNFKDVSIYPSIENREGYKKKRWFSEILVSKGLVTWITPQDLRGNGDSNQRIYAVSRLIHIDLKRTTVLVVEIDARTLDQMIQQTNGKQNTELVLVDDKNQVISATSLDLIDQELNVETDKSLDPSHQKNHLRKVKSHFVQSENGEELLVVSKKLTYLPWSVVSVTPVSELLKETVQIRNVTLIGMGIIAVFTFLINYFLHLKRNEARIYHMAYHDHLTDLQNRKSFYESMEKELQNARQMRSKLAVLFMDLDRFKVMNDTFGHSAGNQILIEVAQRLKKILKKGSVISRIGGDEFLILIPNIINENIVNSVTQQIIQDVQRAIPFQEKELFVSASIGGSIYPKDGQDSQTLIKNADTALYRVKESGRNGFLLYDDTMDKKSYEKLMLERDLRKALENDEIILHYQPQVNLTTGRIVGVEVLARWNHPKHGLISPDVFIPLAEETRMIIPIGEWILYTACKQNKAWQDSGLPLIQVAVNLSNLQFQKKGIVETISKILTVTKLEPQYLELEITESIAMENVEKVLNTMHQLRKLGVKISIDDFGTGYSSLNYLKDFPIHRLKIDRSFLQSTESSSKEKAIVTTIILMAKGLDLVVTAEGVESKEQLGLLKELGCNEVQGYLFSEPLPKEECTQLLQETKGFYSM